MAGTIIDALVVTLGLDSSGFNKGRKEVGEGLDETRDNADRTAKDMEAAGKRAASFFGSIKTELLALVGITLSAQGIKKFVTSMTSDLVRLGVESRSLDMSSKALDGWERSAEAAGSSADRITGNLQALQNVLTQIRTGGGQDDPLFGALASFSGATGANFEYDNDNSEEVMRKIASNWNKLNEDAKRRFGGMFGFDNGIQQGLSSGQLVTDADRFANISRAGEDANKKALELNRRLVEMKMNFSAAAQVLYTALIPYVEKLIPLIEKFGIWITNHGPEIEKFFSDSANEISKVVDAVGDWKNALLILAAFIAGSWALKITSAVAQVAKSFGPLLIAIAAVSAWDKLGTAEDEAKKQGKTTGQYLVDKMNENKGSSDGILGKADTWLKKAYALWDSISDTGDASNQYDAYGTLQPRGIRNKNPGNLNFNNQAGASKEQGENGRFAVFGSMRDGIAALYKQLQLYIGRGVDTIESIVNKYAPASDNNNVGSYVRQLVGATGKGANEKLSGSDTETIFKLMRGIINHENGPDGKKYITDQDILSGIQVGATATAMRQQSMQQQQAQGSKTDIHIGEVNMQTSANNTNALSNDIQRNVQRNRLITPSMSGQGG